MAMNAEELFSEQASGSQLWWEKQRDSAGITREASSLQTG